MLQIIREWWNCGWPSSHRYIGRVMDLGVGIFDIEYAQCSKCGKVVVRYWWTGRRDKPAFGWRRYAPFK